MGLSRSADYVSGWTAFIRAYRITHISESRTCQRPFASVAAQFSTRSMRVTDSRTPVVGS